MAAKKRARAPKGKGKPASRQAKGPRTRSIGGLLSGGLVFLIAAAIIALGWTLIVYPSRPGPGSGREVSVVLSAEGGIDEAIARLDGQGVLSSPRTFGVYARLLGADEHLRTGEVLVRDDMTPREVLQRIARGLGDAAVTVMVPEGFHRFAVAARLARWGVCDEADFLAATEDRVLLASLGVPGPSAEGYLFPDTYRLREGMDPHEVVRRMVENHARRTEALFEENEAGLRELHETLGWGRHEAITLASIVEREAVQPDERPIIAGVFLNRLRDESFVPHRLDADPTVAYGCLAAPAAAPSCATFRGRISRAMTHDSANPYNTYRLEGLPPGPIANPGLASLRAALSPARHRYLFFVATGGGRHTFTETIEEHNRAVAAARGGR